MCCFSGPISVVRNTKIFARSSRDGMQFLVYAMSAAADRELAMILPLPVPPGSPEDCVRFINLRGFSFFWDLESAFEERELTLSSMSHSGSPLRVHQVGAFEASFVPTVHEFDRLDQRFCLPNTVWEEMPAYGDWGFAVFKLKLFDEPSEIHPMAFEFPRSNPRSLYFPTLHVHDESVRPYADFDHALYCQTGPNIENAPEGAWDTSRFPIRRMKTIANEDEISDTEIAAAQTIVATEQLCYRRFINGTRRNEDIYVQLSK